MPDNHLKEADIPVIMINKYDGEIISNYLNSN